MATFFEQNAAVLRDYVRISTGPGSRADYVQGGGGNTSCKFDGRLMAIKASGYRLSQITENNAYAVLDYAAVTDFYRNTDPKSLGDVEAAGAAAAKAAIVGIEGLAPLRPSVEAGFHSLLQKFVLHTHPVYANLAACSAEGRAVAEKALDGAGFSWGYVPYINPGASLTFAIAAEQQRVLEATGEKPSAIFMQNHGFIAAHDNADTCLAIHETVNRRIAEAFGVTEADFPAIRLREVRFGEKTYYVSETEGLDRFARDPRYDLDYYCVNALYPDQLVFLTGSMAIEDGPAPADLRDGREGKCVIYRGSGSIVYSCGSDEARTIEETIAAVTFITSVIERSGRTVVTMSESGKDFISGWESEKYRKTLAGGGK